jgi:hypothetical protein
VLDARGRVVDALPGLYAPRVFLDQLSGAAPAAREFGRLDDAAFSERVTAHHVDLLRSVDGDLAELAMAASEREPTAVHAARLARSKAILERPVVNALSFDRVDPAPPPGLEKLTERYVADARLDSKSRALLLRKHGARTREYGAESDSTQVVARFERSLAEDTAYNEYVLHRQLRVWLADAGAPLSLEALNARVYAELFLTPASDPWLGLFAPDTFAALEPAS